MGVRLTLEYWIDDGWFVGKLREVPGVFSQGETLAELESNVLDAYREVLACEPVLSRRDCQTKEIEIAL